MLGYKEIRAWVRLNIGEGLFERSHGALLPSAASLATLGIPVQQLTVAWPS